MILMKGETVGKSVLKDSYTLLVHLILLGVSLHFDNTAWTIFVAILILFYLAVKASNKSVVRCNSPQEAFTRVCQYYGINAEVRMEKNND